MPATIGAPLSYRADPHAALQQFLCRLGSFTGSAGLPPSSAIFRHARRLELSRALACRGCARLAGSSADEGAGSTGCGSLPIACLTSSPMSSSARIGPKPGMEVGVGEVPLVLGHLDEIANRGVGRPRLPQRGLGQFGGDARLKEIANVGSGHNGVDRRQGRRIERRLLAASDGGDARRRRCRPFLPTSSSRSEAPAASRRFALCRLAFAVSRFSRDQRAANFSPLAHDFVLPAASVGALPSGSARSR